jgi:predicted NAD/FAD-binding protein
MTHSSSHRTQKIAVIGSGIAGLSCAWHLANQPNCDVTLFEKDDRLGGHSNTVDIESEQGKIPVDTGFIVYNPPNYPNLVALFDHLQVPIMPTDMSFAVSVDQGRTEYSGSGLAGLFAQKRNLVNPRFLGMVRDILRFYKESKEPGFVISPSMTLRDLLTHHRFGDAFRDEHLLPMGAAIWSTPMDKMLDYPAKPFLDFCENHGLLQVKDRPQWHTVKGGSREYVSRITNAFKGKILTNRSLREVKRIGGKVLMTDWQGDHWQFDHIVFACHADQALRMLADPRGAELACLDKFRFERNRAVLHSDTKLMPRRKAAWSSWNYLADYRTGSKSLCVTYWMNRLQSLNTDKPMLVTLNPFDEPAKGTIHASFLYDHPVFDLETDKAKKALWDVQGKNNTWFCGAWCGYGFHEDGIQSGLLVAEKLSGVARPWTVENMNARIPIPTDWNIQRAKVDMPVGSAA